MLYESPSKSSSSIGSPSFPYKAISWGHYKHTARILYAFFFIHGIEKKRHTDRTYPSFGERIYKDGGIDIYLYSRDVVNGGGTE